MIHPSIEAVQDYHRRVIVESSSVRAYNVRPPATIAKLVQITPIAMVYGTYNELVTGAYKPTKITEGPHIVAISIILTV